YIHGDVSDGSKYATQFIARLITEKYMSVDSLNGDNGGKQDKFSAGSAGMMYAHNWLNVIVSNILSVNKGLSVEEATAKIALVAPPVGKDGTNCTIIGFSGGFWQGFCINANASKSRIRKCLELYDYLLSEEGYDLLQYGVEGVNYEVKDGKRVTLHQLGSDGIYKSLPSTDTASMLYALVDWTMHYRVTTGTNAERILARQTESEALYRPADYPWLQTTAIIEKLGNCHTLFKETIAVLEKNEGSKYYKAQDTGKYNPKTFGWDDLYKTSTNFDKYWSTFVGRYMSAGGTDMFQEYNDYIASGKAFKVENKI
ncbi:MAG: hypothetical protein K2N18_00920, partial [Clostridia bacterium]|nr:hypothetical protein [Clostridia bacterium]